MDGVEEVGVEAAGGKLIAVGKVGLKEAHLVWWNGVAVGAESRGYVWHIEADIQNWS